jgi:hypothetical protein
MSQLRKSSLTPSQPPLSFHAKAHSDERLLDEVRRIYKGRVVLGHVLDVY